MALKIEHIALWVEDLEKAKNFYCKYFGMTSNAMYQNPAKKYKSFFLAFGEEGTTRIELMQRPDIRASSHERGQVMGFAHLAFSVSDIKQVNSLTELLRADGYRIVGEPRTTGDGYYESVVEDCEGNWIEITI